MYIELIYHAYGDVPIVVRLPETANTERLRTMCPHSDEDFSYGLYTAGQIAGYLGRRMPGAITL